MTGHLQNQILKEVLQGYDAATRSDMNTTDKFSVTSVAGDSFGGAQIEMTGYYRISIFPCASREEEWRFLEPSSGKQHSVIEAGSSHVE